MKKIIVANWKMAPASFESAKKTFRAIKKTADKLHNVQTVVCPPVLYLRELGASVTGHRTVLGAQNAFWNEEEAHTGEHSPDMLVRVGAKYVILGHSERRALGESDVMIREKVRACLLSGLYVIACVGEKERDAHGGYTKFIANQVRQSLPKIKMGKQLLGNIIVAYEPLWAIGKKAKRAASVEDAVEATIFIKKTLVGIFGKDAVNIPILYGGSVNDQNAGEFLEQESVNGLLVGRASLDPETFSRILTARKK